MALSVRLAQQRAQRRIIIALRLPADHEHQRQTRRDKLPPAGRYRCHVSGSERNTEGANSSLQPVLNFVLFPRRQHGRFVDMRDDRVNRSVAPRRARCRRRPASQKAQVFHASRRFLEQRLEQQVQQQIVAPQIDDVGNGRLDLRDVRVVLIRADADVGAAVDVRLGERRHHVQIRLLVRNEIIPAEVAARLG
ncbi:MAG: hypothetical protein Q7S40_17235 [Opitutaceae bacterium]|nr:hypothetical protein [Opitutaceae bacterium]